MAVDFDLLVPLLKQANDFGGQQQLQQGRPGIPAQPRQGGGIGDILGRLAGVVGKLFPDEQATPAGPLGGAIQSGIGGLLPQPSSSPQQPSMGSETALEQLIPGVTRKPDPTKEITKPLDDSTAKLIQDFEGFRETPYWDVNAFRTGFGSDTITKADGSVLPVTQDSRVTREDANRDLDRRIGEFQGTIKKQIGSERFDSLDGKTQSALTSVAYNYGSLPKNVARAARSGDNRSIADSILARRGDNKGVNSKRRTKEVNFLLGLSN